MTAIERNVMAQPGRSDLTVAADIPDYPTMLHALDAAAEQQPERIALVCEDRQMSYAQYRHAVGGMADAISAEIGNGDCVAVIMGNSIEMAVAIFGIMAAGGQMAPLNANLTDHELLPLLTDVAPRLILCSPSLTERVGGLAKRIGGVAVRAVGEEVWSWADDPACQLPDQLPAAEDRAAMFFTGGTTGVPKGAEHLHSSMVAFCRINASVWDFAFDTEVILNVAPMFHIWGHHFTLIEPLFLRATMVIVPQYSPDLVVRELERHRVTLFAGGPAAIYVGLLAAEAIDTADLSALRWSLAGGSPCPENLLTQWKERTGNTILEGWGMSEGAPINANPSAGPQKLLSTGVTPAETEIDIVDLETGTQVLPAGERGEIRLRGPQFTIGYRNKPEETATAIRDGWLYTGDIGYFDEDGYMFLVDRKKELIIVGGYNVYPREIDELLTNHPAVLEAAAIGVPDDFSGEVVKAYVALRPGAAASEAELLALCEENLAKYKRPKAIEILDALPKKGPGKIDKMALKAFDT